MSQIKNSSLCILSLGIIILLVSQITISFGKTDFNPYSIIDKPTDIIWSEHGLIVATGNDGIRLYRIDPRTEKIELFSPTFKGGNEVHLAITLGPTFTSGTVFANQDDTIFAISPDGQTVRDLSTPIEGVNIAALAVDYEKYWNYRLIAITYDGSVWEIDGAGKAYLIANLGNDAIPNGLIVAPADFGDFSGDILISLKNENKIIAISHINHEITDVVKFQGETPELLKYNLRDSTLYASNQDNNEIYSLNSEITSPYITQLMVITEDNQDGNLKLKFIRSTRLGIDVSDIDSGTTNIDISGAIFVSASDFARAMEIPEEEVADIDPRLIIFPILIIVAVATVFIIYKYRGF